MKRNPYKFYTYWWVILIVLIVIPVFKFSGIPLLWSVLIALNASSFLLLGMDKFQATQGGLRIPEKILFLSAFLGGSLGVLGGMQAFRHKTKKTSFQMIIALIVLVQVAAIAYVYNWAM
jgi:uncharacterized membrane protein YsdA (DUF1294 family)